MTAVEVKSLHIYGVKRLQLAFYPIDIFCPYFKKIILTALRFVEIIVRNLIFNVKAYFILNNCQYYQEAPPVAAKIPSFY